MSTINAKPDPNLGLLIKSADGTANLALQTNGANAVVIDNNQNANFVTTGAVTVSSGTTAQRPSSPVNGMWRYNTSFAYIEVYVGGAWANLTPILTPVNSIAPVVSGTPAINQTLSVTNGTWSNSPTSYTYQWLANAIAISANATSNTFVLTNTQVGSNVSCNVTAINSVGSATATSNSVGPIVASYTMTFVAVSGGGGGNNNPGGGGGAGLFTSSSATVTPGTVYTITIGGGGGAATNGTASSISGGVHTGVGGGGSTSTTGGNSANGFTGGVRGGGYGGGGAGSAQNGGVGSTDGETFVAGGDGGAGTATSITGSSVTYAGGGGGAGGNPRGGNGAAGGGTGGNPNNPSAAGANTGSGGGGSAGSPGGASGGSGVIILSVPTSRYSGTTTGSPTVTTNGSNTILRYTASGTYTA